MPSRRRALRSVPAILALALAGAGSLPGQAPPDEAGLATAIAAEVDRLGALPLWPGWEPLRTPLAIYTGSATFLFRHPSPPDGFIPVVGTVPAARRWSGRHPAATSNSSTELGGAATATLLADGPRAAQGPTALAAVALHEAFHVFQRARHPGWSGNEGDLLLYPFGDATLLALRRRESEELRRALTAVEAAVAACHAGLAFAARWERFAAMDSAFSRYERASELNEGLATYVQLRALDRSTVEIPGAEWPATAVRDRFYAVGPALAFLLDRFRPGWREELERDDRRSLDGMLGEALTGSGERGAGSGTCTMSRAEDEAIRSAAARDAGAVVAARTERRRAFDAPAGWRVTVEAADGHPLWPQGFDPLNVELVDGGLLHTRFLRLGNDAGTIEGVDGEADLEAFTEAAGAHPLFNGVRRAVFLLPSPPTLVRKDGKVVVTAPGFRAEFTGRAEERDQQVVIRPGT